MFIIITGSGRVGTSLAYKLVEDNHDVVVLDPEAENLERLGVGFNGLTVQGVPYDIDVLKRAGVERADVVFAVSSDDNLNLVVSEIARKLFKVPRVLTRVNEPEREEVLQRMGFDTICPTKLAVESFENALLTPMFTDKSEQKSLSRG